MFAGFVNSNRSLFVSLARNWKQSGGCSFSVWADGKQLDRWSQDCPEEISETVRAEVRVNGRVIGELRIAGASSHGSADRLQMDADLLSVLVARENDVNLMASELLDTRDQLIALYNLTQKKWTTLDLDSTLDYLAQATANLTRSEAAFVAVQLENGPFQYAASRPNCFDWSFIAINIETLKDKKTDYILVEEPEADAARLCPQIVLLNFHVRGAEIAVVGIRTYVSQSSMSPVIKLLRTIAEYTGSRIENLLMVQESVELAKLQKEMELARNVQSSLLPEDIPSVPGLDIWAVSQPASFVGGDFYDILFEPNRPLTFAVGDISGKGFPASIPMAMAHILIRCHVREFPASGIKNILSAINAELYSDFSRLGIFATLFVCQYNLEQRRLEYANAGHSPVIYCPVDGSPCLLEADGIPLGMLPDSSYSDNQLFFEQGDVLVIGTDAFYETFNSQDQVFSLERLMQQVRLLAHRPAKEIGEGLLASIESFRGDKFQEDDQTLIIIKCNQFMDEKITQ